MSSPTRNGNGSARFALERSLAPHVDERWAEAFILELRLLGVAGTRIGAALTEVESHCVDSGESAELAFGDANQYARSLDFPPSDDASMRAMASLLAPTAMQLAGMFAVNWSFEAVLRGRPLELTTGHLVLVLVVAAAMLALVRFADPVLRLLVQRPVAGPLAVGGGLIAFTGASVTALLVLDAIVWRAPAGWCLGAGAAVLLGGSAWALRQIGADARPSDPIEPPADLARQVPAAASRLGRVIESPRFAALSAAALIPVGTVALLGVTLLLRSLAAS